MANNFVETIQRNLGFPHLKKIDPNDQDTKQPALNGKERMAQAAITAVLTALYRFTRFDEGSNAILAGKGLNGWLPVIFLGKEEEATRKVSHYAGAAQKDALDAMEKIADESVMLLRKTAAPPLTVEKIKTTMDMQRHNILVALPAGLQMGDLLNEETLDDRTNKMEGPVSSFLHKIENFLSKSDQTKYP